MPILQILQARGWDAFSSSEWQWQGKRDVETFQKRLRYNVNIGLIKPPPQGQMDLVKFFLVFP